MNVAIIWNTAQCNPYVNRRFGETYHFHLQMQMKNTVILLAILYLLTGTASQLLFLAQGPERGKTLVATGYGLRHTSYMAETLWNALLFRLVDM
jgi:hypothetical protein